MVALGDGVAVGAVYYKILVYEIVNGVLVEISLRFSAEKAVEKGSAAEGGVYIDAEAHLFGFLSCKLESNSIENRILDFVLLVLHNYLHMYVLPYVKLPAKYTDLAPILARLVQLPVLCLLEVHSDFFHVSLVLGHLFLQITLINSSLPLHSIHLIAVDIWYLTVWG